MQTTRQINFAEAARLDAVQMAGTTLKHCGNQLSHFQSNCRLMMSVITAPPFMTVTSMQWSEACTKAARETFGEGIELATSLQEASPEKKKMFHRLSHQLMEKIVEVDIVAVGQTNSFNLKMAHVAKGMDQLLQGFHPDIAEMFENLLKALTIQAWATYEAMTKELWESIYDSTNKSFARPTRQEWSDNKLGFDARNKIRDTYAFGFSQDPEVLSHLTRAKIDPLALLRNLLVHHGGRVDSIFKKDASYHSSIQTFANLPEGTLVPFGGPMVISVIEPAIAAGYGLIAAVDKWIERNP